MKPHERDGLVARLDSLQHQVDELTRRGGGHSVEIATATLDAPNTWIVFADIPQWYRHLHLVISAGVTSAQSSTIGLRYNGIAANYDTQGAEHAGSTTAAARFNNYGYAEVGVCGPNGWNPSMVADTTIGDYATDAHTFAVSRCSYISGPAALRSWFGGSFYWGTREAVTRISLYPVSGTQFATGSTASLYGLR